MNISEICNNVYNDIEVSVNKLNNNEELSLYDLFLLSHISIFRDSCRTIRKTLEDLNKKELKK